MSCGVGRRVGLDPELLWLPAMAMAGSNSSNSPPGLGNSMCRWYGPKKDKKKKKERKKEKKEITLEREYNHSTLHGLAIHSISIE